MKDYILYQKLLKEVAEGRVTVSQEGDLQIFKYTQETHIQGYWNETNRQARGIIFRTDGTIVARPFAKFFNLGEVSETKLENLPRCGATVFEKLDGSCGIGYHVDGQWRIATPGSLTSEQAKYASEVLVHRYRWEAVSELCTPVFEIVYPGNRIVCDYSKDTRGSQFLALLAIIEHNGQEWHQDRVEQVAKIGGFARPQRYNLDIRGEIPFADNEEGYVVLFENGLRVKVKSPGYVRIHRLLNYLTPKGVIELICGREYRTTIEQLPQSIARDFDDMRAVVQQRYDLYFNRAQMLHHNVCRATDTWVAFESDRVVNRKKQALWIMANVEPDLRGLVFALLDGKNIEASVWKLVEKELKDGPQDSLPSRPNIGADVS